MLRIDLWDLSYLDSGSEVARAASVALRELQFGPLIEQIDPDAEWTLAGSLPLELFIDGQSDLDLIVSAHDLKSFAGQLVQALESKAVIHQPVLWNVSLVMGVKTYVISFSAFGFAFEIFVQSVPIALQNAVRHLLIEARLLELGGLEFHERVLYLRKQGLKTEPAFFEALNSSVRDQINSNQLDPYRFLLEIEELPDRELKKLITF